MMTAIDFSKCNKIIRVILFIGKAEHIKSVGHLAEVFMQVVVCLAKLN